MNELYLKNNVIVRAQKTGLSNYCSGKFTRISSGFKNHKKEADHRAFIRHALEGCRDLYREGYGYKKAGVVITKLVQEEGFSHSLFSDMAALEKESKLSSSIDSIHKAFGRGAVLLGSQGSGEIKMSREH